MREFLIALMMLICCFSGFSQTCYWNVSDSVYQIYLAPHINSEIVGTTEGRVTFDVYETKDGWAKFKYRDTIAYVSSKCIGDYDVFFEKGKVNARHALEDTRWIAHAITIISLVLLMCLVIRFFKHRLTGLLFYINCGALLLISALELVYLYYFIKNFYMIWVVIDEVFSATPAYYLILFPVVAIQLFSLRKTNDDVKIQFETEYSLQWGLKIFVIGVVLFAICAMLELEVLGIISLFFM